MLWLRGHIASTGSEFAAKFKFDGLEPGRKKQPKDTVLGPDIPGTYS